MTFKTGARANHEQKIKVYNFQIHGKLKGQILQHRTGIMVTRQF